MTTAPDAHRRVLVVGGSAFLGGHVVRALAAREGTAVAVMDLRPYGGPLADRVHALIGDLTRPEDCARALQAGPYDAVVNMVTPDLMRAPTEAFERVNVHGTSTLVEACAAGGVRALVHISSIAVMDHFTDHVDLDETAPLPPLEQYRSPYDRSKRLGEELVLAADAPGGLRTCALRMGGILSDMRDVGLRQCLNPVVLILDEGRPIDMIDGRSAAHGIALAVHALLERPGEVGGQAIFLTKGRAVTGREYFSFVAERLGHRLVQAPRAVRPLLRGGLRLHHAARKALGLQVPGLPLHDFMLIPDYVQTFDNSKAERLLGYAPVQTLEEGLAEVIDAWRAESGSES